MLDTNNDVIYKNLVTQLNRNLLASLKQEAEHEEFNLFDSYYAVLNDMAAELLQAKQKGIDLKVDYGERALNDLHFYKIRLFSLELHFLAEKSFYSTAKRTTISANTEDNIKNNDLIKKCDFKPETQISIDAQGNIQHNDLKEKVDLKSSTSSSVFIEEIIASRGGKSSKATQIIKQKEGQANCSSCSVL